MYKFKDDQVSTVIPQKRSFNIGTVFKLLKKKKKINDNTFSYLDSSSHESTNSIGTNYVL